MRLLVADHEARPVQLIDLGTGKTVGNYDVKAPTYVYSSPSGRFGVMIQINANLVTAVDSGIVMEDHGDHFHVYKNDPALTDFVYEGATPIHYTPHEGQFAIFNDASGIVTLLTERNLRLKDEPILTFDSGRPHHGAAVPMGDKVLVTVATTDPDNALPIDVEVRDLQNNVLQCIEGCPGLHGEAAVGTFVPSVARTAC